MFNVSVTSMILPPDMEGSLAVNIKVSGAIQVHELISESPEVDPGIKSAQRAVPLTVPSEYINSDPILES